jgi:hypothetical protein
MRAGQLTRKHTLKRTRNPFVAIDQTRSATLKTAISPIRKPHMIETCKKSTVIVLHVLRPVIATDSLIIRAVTTGTSINPTTATAPALVSLRVPRKTSGVARLQLLTQLVLLGRDPVRVPGSRPAPQRL